METVEMTEVKIGDRIVGKRTGTMTPSTVVGILPAPYYIAMVGAGHKERWDELYPDWKEKTIIFSEFDQPTPNVTFQEFMLGYPLPESSPNEFVQELINSPSLHNKFVRSQYNSLVTPTTRVCYPIDDVDVI